jgi:hypothetical protein
VPERKLVPGEKDEKVWRERDGKVRDLRVCKERNGIADVLLPVCHVCREGGETLTIPPLDPRPTCCPLPLRLVHVGLAAPHVQMSPSFHSFISLTPVIAALSRTITVSHQVVSPRRSIFVSPLSSKATFSSCSCFFHQFLTCSHP